MSIEIKGISKYYGVQAALKDITFSCKKGEILGLLGPNGAGKSTLMKILSCFLTPSAGEATVAGYSITDQIDEIRKIVGYLPEHNPLYTDMYVKEYLRFVGGIYKIPSLKDRVKEIIKITGLEKEQHKKIAQLSKGYRQRVGLAQSLIHDPEILILDEPTSGLDPIQLLEIRKLIKNVGKEKTVIISTHIMQEVEAICDKVVIINHGQKEYDGEVKEAHELEKIFGKLSK